VSRVGARAASWSAALLALEQAWQTRRDSFPTQPQGDALALVAAIAQQFFSSA
jgi:hypothetical protein